MNYYRRHIGDYAAATRHLSLLEHGVYCLMLDVYYTGERALPADEKAVQRLVGARSKDEREAVSLVLHEFFTLDDDGWHQSRCDEEIAKKQEKSETNRAVGRLGGRPRKETQTVSETEPIGLQTETEAVSENNPSHKPIANNQYSEQSSSSESAPARPPPRPRPARRCPPEFEVTADMRLWAAGQSPGVDVDRETEKFRDHQFRDGHSDWAAVWRNWIRKAGEGRVVAPLRPVETAWRGAK